MEARGIELHPVTPPAAASATVISPAATKSVGFSSDVTTLSLIFARQWYTRAQYKTTEKCFIFCRQTGFKTMKDAVFFHCLQV